MNRRLRSFAIGLAPAVLLVACSGGPGATASPASPPAAPIVSASPAPSETPVAVGGNPGVTPIPVDGGPVASGGGVPAPRPTDVTPIANLHGVHDVRATELKASMQGSHLMATLLWWSGPAPCSALAEVNVAKTSTAFTLTVREGAQQLGIACPALALYKQTTVDLGQVAPGMYTVEALGVDQPATVTYKG